MNKFEAKALKQLPEDLYGNGVRGTFKMGADFAYTLGLADAAQAIERAITDGWVITAMLWVKKYERSTAAELIEKYKTE